MKTKWAILVLVAMSPLLICLSALLVFLILFYSPVITDTIYAENFSFRKFIALNEGDSAEHLIDKLGYPIMLQILDDNSSSPLSGAYLYIDSEGNVETIIKLVEREWLHSNPINLTFEDISYNYNNNSVSSYAESWVYSQSKKAPWKTALVSNFTVQDSQIISKNIYVLTD